MQPYISAFFVDPDFVNKLGYHPFTGHRGVNLGTKSKNEWRQGLIRSVSVTAQSEISNTYENEVFRRSLNIYADLVTHNDYWFAVGWDGGEFETFTDSLFSVAFQIQHSNRFNNAKVQYAWG